jgi:hypothetical protein
MMLTVPKFSSAALAFLLAFGAVWSQCCNRHAGNCYMPSPKSDSAKTCPDPALAPRSNQ